MDRILNSKYLFFVILALLINIIVSILFCIKNSKLQAKNILKCSIIETVAIILGAKILDIIVNFSRYDINNIRILSALTTGYVFLGGVFGAVLCIEIYSIVFNEDFKELANIFIPNLLLVYSISKIGCFFAGCCSGIIIGKNILPIQLIEALVYLCIYIFVIVKKRRGYSKIYLTCLLFGFFRFFMEFFRENTDYMYLSISQVLSIVIFIIGIWLYCSDYFGKLSNNAGI